MADFNDELAGDQEKDIVSIEESAGFTAERFRQIAAGLETPVYKVVIKNFVRWLEDTGHILSIFDSADTFRVATREYFEYRATHKLKRIRTGDTFTYEWTEAETSNSTLNSERSAIKRALRELAHGDLNQLSGLNEIFKNGDKKNPFKSRAIDPEVTKDKVLTLAEVNNLITHAGEKDSLFIEFLYRSGCRISEMLGIKLTDLTLVKDYYVIRLDDTKTGNEQKLPHIPARLIERIIEHFNSSTYLFETRGGKGKAYRREYVYQRIRKVGEALLGRKVYPHMLRHSAIERLHEKTGNLKKAQKFARHKSGSTTIQMYLHEGPTDADIENYNDGIAEHEPDEQT